MLVSSADGVGTKLKVAFVTGRHDTVGEDLVNHCVNDIAVQGAVPLFFLDYFAVGKLQAEVAASVVSGIARGCKNNGCALIGGETAEMPGLYAEGEYDLAGFIVGAAERSGADDRREDPRRRHAARRCPPPACTPTAIRWRASCCSKSPATVPRRCCRKSGATVADALLAVHRSYLKPIRALLKAGLLRGAAHITGGGITDNTPRMLPKGLAAAIDTPSWPVPPIFEVLRGIGNIPEDDYRRTFNLGVGMILAVPRAVGGDAPKRSSRKMREPSFRIGEVVAARRGRPRVEYR